MSFIAHECQLSPWRLQTPSLQDFCLSTNNIEQKDSLEFNFHIRVNPPRPDEQAQRREQLTPDYFFFKSEQLYCLWIVTFEFEVSSLTL